ncbi:MAG: CRISPR-associated protein Cas4 [Desulfobacterales bacterium CG07_land_8_20_14_0_80_52_14]|nr:MAG: CRISPR-associated protein Cas4 [Desulfobacterales bacterium CG07_land_8_20_14_0_80_52_14]
MFIEDDLLPLSALQHLLFCERQCSLIHIEQIWSENRFTAEGRIFHGRVDQSGRESRKEVRIEYGVPIRSLRLGLIGKADVVEFHKEAEDVWRPFPVEYKRGRPKREDWDRVQLCAQAICLEEMLACNISRGVLFYGKNRRREEILFDNRLRVETETASARLHDLMASGVTPPAKYDGRCESCSLIDMCMPKITAGKRLVLSYLEGIEE